MIDKSNYDIIEDYAEPPITTSDYVLAILLVAVIIINLFIV